MPSQSAISNLVIGRGKRFADLVDENMLGNALLREPHKIPGIISFTFGTTNVTNYKTTLDLITGGLGKTEQIDSSVYEWQLETNSDKPLFIKRAEINGTIVTPAAFATPMDTIAIWVDEKLFSVGAVLVFDNYDYQARVIAEPINDGGYWVYQLQPISSDTAFSIPGSYLMPGKGVSRLYSLYEEYSDEADILNYTTTVKMSNRLSIMRLRADITGSAATDVLSVGVKDGNGKINYLWGPYQEWLALNQHARRVEAGLIFGKSTMKADGTSVISGTNGRPIEAGAGLYEQIAPFNRRTYTKLTADILDEFLFDLAYNIIGTGIGSQELKFVAFTGAMGKREFSRVLEEKAGAYNLIDTHFVSGSGRDLKLSGEFKTYEMHNGITLTVMHAPIFDDVELNRELDPVTLKPLRSYEFLILYNGNINGKSNIRKFAKRNRELVMRVVTGMTDPGLNKGSFTTVASNAKDGYSLQILSEVGIAVLDPRPCGILTKIAE